MHRTLRINLLCRAGLYGLVFIACFGSSGCSSSSSSGSTTPTPPVSSVSAPTISPTNTSVSGNTPVYITDTESGSTIIYTLNGSTPSAINGSTCAASATTPCFTLLGGATINAVAQDSSGNISTVNHPDLYRQYSLSQLLCRLESPGRIRRQ
ncbi:MAG: FN3 associated domain-containing protein [Acidobacteriaceae bacterium]